MPPFKLFFTGDYLDERGGVRSGDIGLDILAQSGYVQVGFFEDQRPQAGDSTYWRRLYSLEVTAEHVARANGIVIFRPWVKASAFAHGAEELVVLARAGAGYDKIDTEACTANHVVVFNAPDTLTHSTASAALTLLLALAKKLPQQQELVRTGRWDRQSYYFGDDLPGKTLGIIGLGRTGSELARLAAPFHMQVLAYSPSADPLQAGLLGVKLVELEELLRASDFVSLHCRLEKRTRRMLGAEQLRLLKRTAYLINVGRGVIVDLADLTAALKAGEIAGAGLDVFEIEPLPAEHELWRMENVIITPHCAAASPRVPERHEETLLENVRRFAAGEALLNVVDKRMWC